MLIRIRAADPINIPERITAAKTKAAKRAADRRKAARDSKPEAAAKPVAAVSRLPAAAENIRVKR